jgi:hypothetical protein
LNVIDTHHSVTPVVSGLPSRPRLASVVQPVAGPESTARSGARVAADGADPRAYRVEPVAVPAGGETASELGLRGLHALQAYAGTQGLAERDYVSRVFGVDDWA